MVQPAMRAERQSARGAATKLRVRHQARAARAPHATRPRAVAAAMGPALNSVRNTREDCSSLVDSPIFSVFPARAFLSCLLHNF